eukprot:g13164.t1
MTQQEEEVTEALRKFLRTLGTEFSANQPVGIASPAECQLDAYAILNKSFSGEISNKLASNKTKYYFKRKAVGQLLQELGRVVPLDSLLQNKSETKSCRHSKCKGTPCQHENIAAVCSTLCAMVRDDEKYNSLSTISHYMEKFERRLVKKTKTCYGRAREPALARLRELSAELELVERHVPYQTKLDQSK